MKYADELVLFALTAVAFIVVCLKVGGVTHISRRPSYPRAYWFGIACFALMVIVLFSAVTWDVLTGG